MDTTPPPHDRCPACGAYLPATPPPACPRCALPLLGPVAEELRETDRALLRLDAERGRLIARRGQLLAQLRPPYPPAPWGTRPAPPRGGPPRRETSPRAVQNLLLALGGVLLAVAAIAFTVISWGHLGIGGRAAVLGALTLAATGVPSLLLRRALTATAEVVACLGLVLLLLDAYALHRVVFSGTDGLRYAAVSLAVVTALWAGYGKALGRLVLPVPFAVAIGQLPLALWASAAQSAYGLATALLVTAALDAAAALLTAGRGTRITAAVAGTALGTAGLLTAGGLSLSAGDTGAALRAGALLLGAAAVALAVALRPAVPAAVSGILSGVVALAVVGAAGGLVRAGVPGDWVVPEYLVCAAVVLGAAALAVPARLRPVAAGLAAGAATVHALALLWALPSLVVGVLTPDAWDGAYGAVAVAGLLAAELAAAARLHRGTPYGPVAASGALVSAALAVCVPGPLPVRLVVVAALLALSARALTWTALATACGLAATAVAWAHPQRTTTLIVLAVLTACLGALYAVASHTRVVSAAAVVACAAGLAWTGLPAHAAAFTLLAIAAAAQAAALRTPGRFFEHPGHAAALLGVVLVADDRALLALALALAGVLAAAVAALRADRRWLGYVATCLMVAAGWVRLAASDVHVPEAYTLPVTVAALGVGALRRRRDSAFSSWAAYAPGLSATLLPSLAAAWGDPGWVRPLFLGAASLAVMLLGARHRLAAPLLLGSGVLALDALHELAPYIAQALGALPRWVPLALAGVLLLAVGATYEHRLRDVRRVRDALGRLR
ncbi:SCO7613 C-terminal domain-containing membrane protein [Actinacidiphila sp. bgisy160]|uniref:SCO7613 C-terminal domain-containing membrane protein n=1 Tax=Actinacidiphila sp. bgisy160 TaxID=3413796 RepID=UPI003D7537DD